MLETKPKKQMKIFPYFFTYLRLARLHQPTGIWLLFLPCLFGILLATKCAYLVTHEVYRVTVLFFVGSLLMRSAGCIINDLCDRKFDVLVTRTKNRPLASGEISVRNALILLFVLLLASLAILLSFNVKTIVSGFVALALVATYPLMKRFTYYPQVFLGLTFNFGILMSNLALIDRINFSTIFLYFAAIVWTVIYDTIYAFQDIEDDLRFGVKSTAIKFQNRPKEILNYLCLAMLASLVFCGLAADLSAGYFFGILLCCSALISKIKTSDLQKNSPENFLALFKMNVWFGVGIALSIWIG